MTAFMLSQLTVERYSGKEAKGQKHGKFDPKNEPHVGGNTWAGGTGGRDTAGACDFGLASSIQLLLLREEGGWEWG